MPTKLDQALQKIVVMGAAGKMGSGIALMALRLPGTATQEIVLLDSDPARLEGLRSYLLKHAEDPKLLEKATFTTDINACKDATIVFEAILEDEEIKTNVYKKLKPLCSPDCIFLTNTSSIPITVLDERAGLGGRILGFHFYNPPAVQKLVELIWSEKTQPSLKALATELGKRMDKVLVFSYDVAGFIGNGHFMRDLLFACDQVEQLRASRPTSEAIFLINRVSQDWLVRPMGIFQLVDYVGLDVCRNILKVMTSHIHGQSFGHSLLDELAADGKLGGQFADGSQKDGILKYVDKRPAGVWNHETKEYRSIESINDKVLGPLPAGHHPWKALSRDAEKDVKLKQYFVSLKSASGMGSELARQYLANSRKIAEELVTQGVAEKISDVDEVLRRGFAHLYGPGEGQ